MLVGEEEKLSQLRHHGWRTGREVGEYPDHGLVVLVEEQEPSLDLWEEKLDRAPDSLQLLEGDVLELVWARPKASGFYAVVEDNTPAETA